MKINFETQEHRDRYEPIAREIARYAEPLDSIEGADPTIYVNDEFLLLTFHSPVGQEFGECFQTYMVAVGGFDGLRNLAERAVRVAKHHGWLPGPCDCLYCVGMMPIVEQPATAGSA